MKRLKEFWLTYCREIIRFITNQLVMSFLGLSVGLATIALGNTMVSMFGCVFSILFLCCLQYDSLFQTGSKDCYKSSAIPHPKKSLGLKIAFLGSVPLLLLVLVGALLAVFTSASALTALKLCFYALEGGFVQLHALIISKFALVEKPEWIQWVLFLTYTIPAILAGAFGYFMGASDKTLRSFFGFPSTKKTGK